LQNSELSGLRDFEKRRLSKQLKRRISALESQLAFLKRSDENAFRDSYLSQIRSHEKALNEHLQSIQALQKRLQELPSKSDLIRRNRERIRKLKNQLAEIEPKPSKLSVEQLQKLQSNLVGEVTDEVSEYLANNGIAPEIIALMRQLGGDNG
jgi:DNA repair exonuclease SbcCD ATPase subunit